LLHEQLALCIEDKQRERAMQLTLAIMASGFVEVSNGPVLCVDEDESFRLVGDDF